MDTVNRLLILFFSILVEVNSFGYFAKFGKIYSNEKLQRVSNQLCMQFSLESFTRNHLIVSPYKLDHKYINTVSSTVEEAAAQFHESKAYVILVDITIRSLDDLDSSLSLFPFWKKFVKKLNNAQNDVSLDKFIYDHDVGDEQVTKVVIARIPSATYQKLDLARRIVSATASALEVIVFSMVSKPRNSVSAVNDERANDMKGPLASAYQINRFKIPSFKRDSEKTNLLQEAYLPVTIRFIEGLADGLEDRLSTERAVSPVIETKSLPTNKDRATAIEEAMIKAAKERDASNKLQSITDSILEGESMAPSMTKGLESFNDFIEAPKPRPIRVGEAIEMTASEKYKANGQEVKDYWVTSSTFRLKAANHGSNIARSLSSLPPNVLHPKAYVSLIRVMAEEYGWEFSEWTAQELKELGCGAFYAVCAANQRFGATDRLVRLVYRGSKKLDSSQIDSLKSPLPSTLDAVATASVATDRPIVLVGKGVCYDTGGKVSHYEVLTQFTDYKTGVNLKSANSMKTMKHDMTGSAVALGVLTALTLVGSTEFVECWLPIVENNMMIPTPSQDGPDSADVIKSEVSYRPDDVVKAVTGDTIEIVHTDAEGRMILADVLALASKKVVKPPFSTFRDSPTPKLLIDFATLTGTCISSLTNRYIGAFTNKRSLVEKLIVAGERSGERLWPLPLDDDFSDDLKSDVADILQCRQPTEGDHIYAASFLNRFVNPIVPWIHLDLASAYRSGGLGHVDSDYTGSGVIATMELLKLLGMK